MSSSTRTRLKPVGISADQEQRPLSKGQKAFNTLIKQIEERRARLAAWEAAIPRYHQRYASELLPLIADSQELQLRMVHCLDSASDAKALSKTERRTLSGLVSQLAAQLVAARDDAELKAIYQRHSGTDYDQEQAANMNGLQSLFEDVLGFEFGDDLDPDSPEDLFARAEAQMRQQQQDNQAWREAQEARRAKRKKSAKQLAREAQQEAEDKQISQSIREVYRKLASALHPDRESDPDERARKTVLMQRANQAYDKKNLLQLLELQLELEHIDQATINGLSEDRLKHYNTVLKGQLAELQQEIIRVEAEFRGQFGVSLFDDVSPTTIMRGLARDIADLRNGMVEMERDLRAFADIKQLKSWLKQMRRRPAVDEFADVPF